VAGFAINTVVTKTLTTQIINMNAGDYLNMRIRSYPDGVAQRNIYQGGQLYTILTGASQTFLQVVDTSITGGTFLDIDPNLIKVQLHKFSYPMTQQEFNGVLNNPTGRIGFAMENQPYRYGWIKELKYNHTFSRADFVLTTNRESEHAS